MPTRPFRALPAGPLAQQAAFSDEKGVDIGGQRRSDKFEDRGRGNAGKSGGGGVPIQLLTGVFRLLGVKGTLVLGAALGVGYFLMPSALREQLLGGALGSNAASSGSASGSVCQSSPENASACDFGRAVLGSTEDVWQSEFRRGSLPDYENTPSTYDPPTLVVFTDAVSTGGCGSATAATGPFYCPADKRLYIDPSFYDVLAKKLKAPGDFAQAYVIAHEVGHHIQNLIGSSRLTLRGESKNQASVRVELQADCLAGVWGHAARGSLSITEEDLSEALGAAHAIGDDALGHSNSSDYTHGTSAQRIRWFKKGFVGGDARQCDTFAVQNYAEL